MGEPGDRAAGPGAQPVRVDNIKLKSQVTLPAIQGRLVGRIYFKTDDATLDNGDMEQLEKLVSPYQGEMSAYPKKQVNFSYYGVADYRYGDPAQAEAYNRKLSQKRADAVAIYLGQPERLGQPDHPNYYAESKGLGIDWTGKGEPATSEAQAPFRRVDIWADPLTPYEERPPAEKPTAKTSTKWKARIVSSLGGGPPGNIPLQVDLLYLEVVDLTNTIAMTFRYTGLGIGKSFKGLPGYSASKSSWFNFKTMLPYSVMDFEGDAAHLSGQGQLRAGYSYDAITLWGRSGKRFQPRVRLEWEGFSNLDNDAAGLGASVTAGMTLPKSNEPYAAPTD